MIHVEKKILILTNIMLIILISVAGIYFKMKYDEKKNKNQFIIKNNKSALHFYLKHNTIEPNTIKSVHFTNLETSPMGSAMIEGYINENKKIILLLMLHQNIIINLVAL